MGNGSTSEPGANPTTTALNTLYTVGAFLLAATPFIAAGAMGYGANWITDWYSYDPAGRALMGVREGEQVAGVIYIGTASEDALERVRPDVEALTTRL